MDVVKKSALENLDFLSALYSAERNLKFALSEITYPNWIDEDLNKGLIDILKDTIDTISRVKEYVANRDIDILKPE